MCGHLISEGFGDQSATQDRDQVLSHGLLLLHSAVVLQRQDHRVLGRLVKGTMILLSVRYTWKAHQKDKLYKSKNKQKHPLCFEFIYLKGIFFNGLNHIFKEDL